MFLVAVAGPRQLSNGACFDGKIGIWPVTKTVKAKRSSKNRAAGKVLADDDKEVIPAIKARIPGASTRSIRGQQDGAKLHARNRVIGAVEAAAGGNITL
ncbi:unnamed protein product [Discosporangium mesarthrocarpum]